VGITGERALPRATLQLNYRFSRMGAQGLKFGPDPFPELDALDLYTYVPLDKTVDVHTVGLGFWVTDELTLVASGGWISKSRTAANEDVFFMNETSWVSDLEVDALWQVYGLGAWRAYVQLGVIALLGSVEERGDFPDASNVQLPYDMQIGTGSWSLVPAIGGQVMNEGGSVGGLIRGIFPLMHNDRDYRAGVKADLRLWGAYRFSDFVSVSGEVRATATRGDQGGALETLRDPGDLGLEAGGPTARRQPAHGQRTAGRPPDRARGRVDRARGRGQPHHRLGLGLHPGVAEGLRAAPSLTYPISRTSA